VETACTVYSFINLNPRPGDHLALGSGIREMYPAVIQGTDIDHHAGPKERRRYIMGFAGLYMQSTFIQCTCIVSYTIHFTYDVAKVFLLWSCEKTS
jgi:hypothetical protein